MFLGDPKPYEFIGFGDIHGPKSYKFIGFGEIRGLGAPGLQKNTWPLYDIRQQRDRHDALIQGT